MWVLVLVSLLMPNVLVLPVRLISWVGPQGAYASEGAGAALVKAPAPPVAGFSWEGVALVAWVIVAAGFALLLLRRAISVKLIIARAKEANSLMKGVLWYCRTCMGVRREVRLKVSEEVSSPALCGLVRPVIVVPHDLAPSLGSRHLRAVLLHELAHVKRGDLWVNLLQLFLLMVYFYNPLLWVANWMIRRVREEAVDEQVVVVMGDKAHWYAESLTNVSKLSVQGPALSLHMIGLVESKETLAGRVRHIRQCPTEDVGRAEAACGGGFKDCGPQELDYR